MNATELRTLQRRIDRTRKLAMGMQRAAEQLNEHLAMIEAFVRDAQQPVANGQPLGRTERASRGKRVAGLTPAEQDELLEHFAQIMARR